MSYIRTNRILKTKIRLFESVFRDDPLKWWLKCETHGKGGPTQAYNRKCDALADMAHPWEWCRECATELEELGYGLTDDDFKEASLNRL